MALYELLFDLTPDAALEPAVTVPAEHGPSPFAVTSHLAWSLAATPVRVARSARDIAGAAVGVARFRGSDLWADALQPFQSPKTSLNGPIDGDRHCAHSTMSLVDVKTVKRAAGVTVNDVVLAACGGALRSYFRERGEEPKGSLSASVPVSVDAGGGGSGGSVIGNAVSNFGATLATDIADPLERLQRIAASTRAAKGLHSALGPEAMLRLADVLPPGLSGAAMRGMSSPRLAAHTPPPYNVIISNLPGPPVPLYSGGARLVASHVFGPLIQGLGLNITVLSYVDSIAIGVNACPGLVPDPWLIADGIPAALDELVAAVACRG
jgi:diacylglycerol O-acyltransferase / wax synthase